MTVTPAPASVLPTHRILLDLAPGILTGAVIGSSLAALVVGSESFPTWRCWSCAGRICGTTKLLVDGFTAKVHRPPEASCACLPVAHRAVQSHPAVPDRRARCPATIRIARTKAFVILDGTLLPIDRIAADMPYYSGKHKRHGMNAQVLTDLFGHLLRASPALPGSPTT